MIDVYILASLIVVLVAGSVRIAIEIYVRLQARRKRRVAVLAEDAASPMLLDEPPSTHEVPRALEPQARQLDGNVTSMECTPPVALFSVEMGPAVPRLRITIGDRAIPVDIQPWQAAALGQSLFAALAACASGAQRPPEGTVFP